MLRLKELRNRNGKKISQQELADYLNVGRSTVAMWETAGIEPDNQTLVALSDYFGVTIDYILGKETEVVKVSDLKEHVKKIFLDLSGLSEGKMMPVLGRVQAGLPSEIIHDIVGEIAVTEEMAKSGEYFALKVRGRSMEPMLYEDFVVIVKRQSDIESGEIGVVIINGSDATIKKVEKQEEGILLIPINNEFKTEFYSNEKIRALPVEVIGKVVEFRGKL